MIPHITRGDRMGGLLVYLAGPGKVNEHTEPHLVAGDSAIMAWHGTDELDREAALAIAREVDAARRLLDVEVSGGHVWHASLSIRADEGQLSDETWAEIAEGFVEEMGFTEAAGKAACRWVAVRHGLSGNGNDHVHVAVSLVREDGTKASVWNDRPRAQRVAGDLERRHGLVVLESRQHGRGSPGFHPAEQVTATRRGEPEVARDRLARTVRGCAAAAGDEAEFVRRARRAGVLIRPRFGAGRDDVIAGYSVGLRPPVGERPVWYGGGHLSRDLSLPKLRDQWPDTPQHAEAAAAEWRAAHRGGRVVAPGAETVEPDPALWERYTQEIRDLREQLRAVDPGDRETWAHVARETSGAFAAWSIQVEPEPGPLAAAADSLARSAQLHRREPRRPVPTQRSSAKGAAMLLASIAHGGNGTVAQAVLLRQLSNTARAIHDAHVAGGEAKRAGAIASIAREQLRDVAGTLPVVPSGHGRRPAQTVDEHQDSAIAAAARLQAATHSEVGKDGSGQPGSPVPNRVRPTAPHEAREHDIER